MTETEIQNALATRMRGRGHEYIVPNVSPWGRIWEADVVSITKSGYAVEYEIKCSDTDFRKDKEKRRHQELQKDSPYIWRGHGPCRFLYVFSPDVDTGSLDIPDYAGVVEPTDTGCYSPNLREAPRLHDKKVHNDGIEYLARGLMHRYWDLRLEC